jgi:hypothetical protein
VYEVPGARIGEAYWLPCSNLVTKSSRLYLRPRVFISSLTVWILDGDATGEPNVGS